MPESGGLGRIEHFDPRNLNYLISDVINAPQALVKRALLTVRGGSLAEPTAPQPGHRYYWDSAWWEDQGQTAQCTAAALIHGMADGPVTHPGQNPIMDREAIYAGIQAIDKAEGRNYGYDGGATSLAMAKFAVSQKWIGEYRWGYTLNDFIAAIATGPVFLGIDWYEGFDDPDKTGIIRKTGGIRGGHEIECNGADFRAGMARLKQSWGKQNYGRGGHAYLPFEDLDELIHEGGDVTLFRELKTDDPRTKRDESIVR